MTTHAMVHKLKFIEWQLIEAKKYMNNQYGQGHIDTAIDECVEMGDEVGKQLIEKQ